MVAATNLHKRLSLSSQRPCRAHMKIASFDGGVFSLPKQPSQPLSPSLLHHLHQLLRFAELLDQTVHILHFHASTSRDAPATRGVQNIGVAAFLACHRIDDRFSLLESPLNILRVNLTCGL